GLVTRPIGTHVTARFTIARRFPPCPTTRPEPRRTILNLCDIEKEPPSFMSSDPTFIPSPIGVSCMYCDVSLPVPLDHAFTYSIPETLRHRVQAGCRVLAPFGNRKLSGVVMRTHNDPAPPGASKGAIKEILKLLDE